MNLYERNFFKVASLIPDLELLGTGEVVSTVGESRLVLRIIERFKYTSTVSLTQPLHEPPAFVNDPCMTIRIYHDLRVVEVLSFQNHGHFQPRYQYPNPKMYQPREKRQVNRFLGEWLTYVIRKGHCFAPHEFLR